MTVRVESVWVAGKPCRLGIAPVYHQFNISPFRRKIPSFLKNAVTARDARVQFCVLLRRKRPGEREKELTMFLFYNSIFRKKSVPAEGVHIAWCDLGH